MQQNQLIGLQVVVDSFLCPNYSFLNLVCRENGEKVVIWSLDQPVHRVSWQEQCRVEDKYSCGLEDLKGENLEDKILIIAGLTLMIKRHGVAKVLNRLLQIQAVCILIGVHEDCLPPKVLESVFGAAKTIVTIRTDDVVQMVVKKKGGKVLRTTEKVLDWKKLTVKSLDETVVEKKEFFNAASHLSLEDANVEEKNKLNLPFVKTEVSGKMIFDVADMKAGDYEDDADKSSEEEDPDADLDL